MRSRQILNILPREVKEALTNLKINCEYLQEIRMRIGCPILFMYQGKEMVGHLVITEKVLKETIDYVCNYSIYAYENELKQGFITVEGGHRVGVAGSVALEQGHVKNIKYIASLNIRVSHEILHCADRIFAHISNQNQLYHTMIISPPRCGKTTLLRDVIRQISDGNRWVSGRTVGVVDERSELAGCYRGIPQNHMGMRTDVLDGCPKAEGMLMLIRSMAPQVIAVDEIGASEDVQAMKYAMHCGCKMIATAHGGSLEEIQRKPLFQELITERFFERYILLQNVHKVGEIVGVYDQNGKRL